MDVKNMIDLVLVKNAMLYYVQDVKVVRGRGKGFSDHHVVFCKVRLVGTWINRREMVNGARRIKSEKLRNHQYMEGYVRRLECKVNWDKGRNVEKMLERVKRAKVDSAREVYGSARVEGKNPKNIWLNEVIKAAINRKMAAWMEVLGARDKVVKDRRMEVYKEEKRKVKRCIYQSKKEANEQFGRKVNQDVDGNIKSFWKEVSKLNEGKVESCSRINDVHWEGMKYEGYGRSISRSI